MSNRVNRVLVALAGLLLLIVGSVAVAARWGRLDLNDPRVFYGDAREAVTVNEAMGAAIAIAGGLVLLLGGLSLVRRELTLHRRPHADALQRTGERGHTRIEAGAVEKAIAWQTTQIAGVRDAKARLLSTGASPRVAMRLQVFPNAQLEKIPPGIEKACVAAGEHLSMSNVRTTVDIEVTDDPVPRVE